MVLTWVVKEGSQLNLFALLPAEKDKPGEKEGTKKLRSFFRRSWKMRSNTTR